MSNYFRACRPWSIRILFPVISQKTTFRILKNSEAGHENLNIKLIKYLHSHIQIKLYLSFIRTIYLHRNVNIFPTKITIILKNTYNKQLLIKLVYSTAIRTWNLMHREVAALTARLRISFFWVPLNKVHYIFQIFFRSYYRGFLECFWIVGHMPLSLFFYYTGEL